MASLMGTIFGEATGTDMERALGLNAAASAGAMANAYLAASLQAATPEVKRLFADYLNQSLTAQGALTELSTNRGWAKPYESPGEQLQKCYRDSQETLKNE